MTDEEASSSSSLENVPQQQTRMARELAVVRAQLEETQQKLRETAVELENEKFAHAITQRKLATAYDQIREQKKLAEETQSPFQMVVENTELTTRLLEAEKQLLEYRNPNRFAQLAFETIPEYREIASFVQQHLISLEHLLEEQESRFVDCKSYINRCHAASYVKLSEVLLVERQLTPSLEETADEIERLTAEAEQFSKSSDPHHVQYAGQVRAELDRLLELKRQFETKYESNAKEKQLLLKRKGHRESSMKKVRRIMSKAEKITFEADQLNVLRKKFKNLLNNVAAAEKNDEVVIVTKEGSVRVRPDELVTIFSEYVKSSSSASSSSEASSSSANPNSSSSSSSLQNSPETARHKSKKTSKKSPQKSASNQVLQLLHSLTNMVPHSLSDEQPDGPAVLPRYWERAVDESGQVYYIDHKNQKTQWNPPDTDEDADALARLLKNPKHLEKELIRVGRSREELASAIASVIFQKQVFFESSMHHIHAIATKLAQYGKPSYNAETETEKLRLQLEQSYQLIGELHEKLEAYAKNYLATISVLRNYHLSQMRVETKRQETLLSDSDSANVQLGELLTKLVSYEFHLNEMASSLVAAGAVDSVQDLKASMERKYWFVTGADEKDSTTTTSTTALQRNLQAAWNSIEFLGKSLDEKQELLRAQSLEIIRLKLEILTLKDANSTEKFSAAQEELMRQAELLNQDYNSSTSSVGTPDNNAKDPAAKGGPQELASVSMEGEGAKWTGLAARRSAALSNNNSEVPSSSHSTWSSSSSDIAAAHLDPSQRRLYNLSDAPTASDFDEAELSALHPSGGVGDGDGDDDSASDSESDDEKAAKLISEQEQSGQTELTKAGGGGIRSRQGEAAGSAIRAGVQLLYDSDYQAMESVFGPNPATSLDSLKPLRGASHLPRRSPSVPGFTPLAYGPEPRPRWFQWMIYD